MTKELKLKLINEILRTYHKTRIADGTTVGEYILGSPWVQDAFDELVRPRYGIRDNV